MRTIHLITGKKVKWFSGLTFLCVMFIVAFAFSCSSSGENKQEQREQDPSAQSLTKTIIPIEGMTCNACVASIKKKLRSLDGIEEVEVSLEQRNATVLYEEGNLTPQKIKDAINEIGYKAGEPVTEKIKQ